MSHIQQLKDGDFSPGCSSVQQERSDSAEPSCVSMKSDWSIDPPPEMKDGEKQSASVAQQERSDSAEPSCVSMKSDWSIDPPPEMKDGDRSVAQQKKSDSAEPSCVSMKSDWSIDLPPEMKDGDRSQSVHDRLRISDCGVTDEGCAALASALRSNPSHLTELNLSWNKLGSSGVALLCSVLKNPQCKLEKLWTLSI